MQHWIAETLDSQKPRGRTQSEWYIELMMKGLKEYQKEKGNNGVTGRIFPDMISAEDCSAVI